MALDLGGWTLFRLPRPHPWPGCEPRELGLPQIPATNWEDQSGPGVGQNPLVEESHLILERTALDDRLVGRMDLPRSIEVKRPLGP